jgi:hypothetical protein
MTKVIVRHIEQTSKAGGRKPPTVTESRASDGSIIRTVDARSETFGGDFLYAFRKNVVRARRENKRLTGSADGRVDKR